MAVRIVTALDARNRLKTCAEFLLNAGQEEVLIVSATRMAADELARRLCLAKRGGFGLHRFSAGALAVEIASPQLALSGKSILAGIAVDALPGAGCLRLPNWFRVLSQPAAGTAYLPILT